jgi:hypothetical protein
MADTFGNVWRQVRLHCPAAPVLLAQEWARAVYRDLSDAKEWAFRRSVTDLRTTAATTGTISVAVGSSTATTDSLVVASTDVGRQIRVSGKPLYTILGVSGATLTLDRPWAEDALVSGEVTLLSAYVTLPTDLARLTNVYDAVDSRQLDIFVTSAEIDYRDPARLLSGNPRCLVAFRPSASGVIRYELWPHPADARTYHVTYLASVADPTDATELPGVFGQKRQLLLTGALARAALWPGTETRRNPYFSLPLARQLSEDFARGLDEAMLEDENLYLTWLKATPSSGEEVGMRDTVTPRPDYDDAW